MIYDDNDIQSAALCAWKEARGEGADGCAAVLHVLKNRVGSPGFAHDLHSVIYGKNQFTSMSVPSDPEFNLQPSPNDLIFASCVTAAREIFGGDCPDPTRGAHYYANLKNVTSGWFFRNIVDNPAQHPVTAKIGRHTFFS